MEIEQNIPERTTNQPLLEEIASSDLSEEQLKKARINKIVTHYGNLKKNIKDYKKIKPLCESGIISKEDYKEFKSLSKKVAKGIDYVIAKETGRDYCEAKETEEFAGQVIGGALLFGGLIGGGIYAGIAYGLNTAIGFTTVCGMAALLTGDLWTVPGKLIYSGALGIKDAINKKHYKSIIVNFEKLERKRAELSAVLERTEEQIDSTDAVIYLAENKMSHFQNLNDTYEVELSWS